MPVWPSPILIALLPHALVLPHVEVFVIREFLIVTLFASMSSEPVTCSPSMTAPLVVIVRPDEDVSVVPAGTPTLPAAESG
ncbi:MAG: hypothetical protein WBP81_34885 [Solirubrobacteraceae bacterium]